MRLFAVLLLVTGILILSFQPSAASPSFQAGCTTYSSSIADPGAPSWRYMDLSTTYTYSGSPQLGMYTASLVAGQTFQFLSGANITSWQYRYVPTAGGAVESINSSGLGLVTVPAGTSKIVFWYLTNGEFVELRICPVPATPTLTPSITLTPSLTPSITLTPSLTPSITPTATEVPSLTPTPFSGYPYPYDDGYSYFINYTGDYSN